MSKLFSKLQYIVSWELQKFKVYFYTKIGSWNDVYIHKALNYAGKTLSFNVKVI